MTIHSIRTCATSSSRTSCSARKSSLADDESFLEAGVIDSTGVLELVGFLESRLRDRRRGRRSCSSQSDSVNSLTRFVERKLKAQGDAHCRLSSSSRTARAVPREDRARLRQPRLTYRELDRVCESPGARASLPQEFSAATGSAIFLENSVEAVTRVFATLKAGGAFVVVNPTTKADKLAFILNNSRAPTLITDARRRRAARAKSRQHRRHTR